MDSIGNILRDKGSSVRTTTPDTTVQSAVEAMCKAHVGALVVIHGTSIVGIFSERDLMMRVVLTGRDPAGTQVGDVMTRGVLCVPPELPVRDAMAVITRRRVRHLPVVEETRLVGIISIGDLVRWRIRDCEQEIGHLREYFAGYPV
jgi:CBS domain-containing protein